MLAKRGVNQALTQWKPTADYLTEKIPHATFELIPLGFDEVTPKVSAGEIDFLITNPSMYVEMETLFGVSRLATLKNLGPDGRALTVFGGVIFTKANRSDIHTIADLKKINAFMAVKENSLGGFQVAWHELTKYGIDPYTDFKRLIFRSKHDSVVLAVGRGDVDAGTVRTDTLERMHAEGKINIDDFKVIGSGYGEKIQEFPYKVSTVLMPEWPFAKLDHTPDKISQEVTVALLEMQPDSYAAKFGKNAGWTVPLNYQPVRSLMQDLRIGPFRDFGKPSLKRLMTEYWRWITGFTVFLTFLIWLLSYIIKINRRISASEKKLTVEVNERISAEKQLAERGEALRAEVIRNTASLQHLEKIRKFHELTSLLITTLNPKALLQKALDRVVELSECQIGGIFLYDEKSQQVRPYVFHGVSAKSMSAVGLGESLPAQVIADRKPRHIRTLPNECALTVDFGLWKSCPKELLMLPMLSKESALGMITLGSINGFAQEDIEVLSHMADQISIMLENALANEEMERLSTIDSLTGLYNRRQLNEFLDREVKKALRHHHNIGLLVMDVDHFKKINDDFGHPEGDVVLVAVAEALRETAREIDILGRFGGEEFVAILPSTDLAGAKALGEKMRDAIANLDLSPHCTRPVTISIGVTALWEANAKSVQQLVKQADQALYTAKATGRNRCCVAASDGVQ
ncbi:putative diguanylate cyclase [Magnetofaba australis IT-1]|uniref:diguanylate cyclase n=1 Tax=Magnetofaba australis IT-1 TaxID=1434232 RepID=A0A1Y2K6R8_9PROT|nr:putative diguanylate cyclase [Magnetofaba australis IT-1]